MPDANTTPPGFFRNLETLATAFNQAVAQIEALGGDVSTLPVDDPVRVAVEGRVDTTMRMAEGVPPGLRGFDPDYGLP
jgi:hypothetical protein